MPKLKTHQATAKRIRVSKNKKLIQRTAGQDHFNARESGKITAKKRRDHQISQSNVKAIRELIH